MGAITLSMHDGSIRLDDAGGVRYAKDPSSCIARKRVYGGWADEMSPEEIRVRSIYLFSACSQSVEHCKDQLAPMVPTTSGSAKLQVEQALRREFGMLVRHWTTREIWSRLDADEAAAKDLNLALLRLFTEGFKLPKDGSGLRYAELLTPAEEVRELSRRLTSTLGAEHRPLLDELQRKILMWREEIAKHTVDAISLPLDELSASVKEWLGRPRAEP